MKENIGEFKKTVITMHNTWTTHHQTKQIGNVDSVHLVHFVTETQIGKMSLHCKVGPCFLDIFLFIAVDQREQFRIICWYGVDRWVRFGSVGSLA